MICIHCHDLKAIIASAISSKPSHFLSPLCCLLMVSLMDCLTKMSGAQTSLDLREALKAKSQEGRGPREGVLRKEERAW